MHGCITEGTKASQELNASYSEAVSPQLGLESQSSVGNLSDTITWGHIEIACDILETGCLVFFSSWPNVHPYKQCMRLLIFPFAYLFFFKFFFIIVALWVTSGIPSQFCLMTKNVGYANVDYGKNRESGGQLSQSSEDIQHLLVLISNLAISVSLEKHLLIFTTALKLVFVFVLLTHRSSLYSLGIKPLSHMLLTNTFLPYCGFFF